MGVRDDLLAIPDELLRTGRVSEATLVFMDFRDNPRRWWTGLGDLDVAGEIWSGVSDLISISDIETTYAATAQPVSFSLAATEKMIDDTQAAESTVHGRTVAIFGQLFYTQADLEHPAWHPVGSPFAHFVGTMEKVSYSFSGLEEGSISLACEGLFYRRTTPPRGLLTDSDQKSRSTGDRGLELVAKYTEYETRWL
ncbi:hypothetical protein UM399_11870 [Sulfitobacter pontiacus]|uniref:hypothetical protein n=1 Tax=Sulfitobacter pontiacus TaxID=60137 RepID=UPI002AC8C346|nr:hypothetical protein [Sulfitobacter pontiacus]WPZ24860.1 hypothetical protein UM399_11870 [Sulfitobacter pontiacus]